eukprot:CAMPEP_0113614128 /NCGR_PEP_ID=MMETSP0017_2-20120614/7001_1 /TAXON_ID=2856 /ORGANISM="Cylindrotheca closterium" /LENGTH=1705 /DNA_ID=CAMNT_0000523275 /DNA_START=147 /DNA_END=5264 /DNA_ORIENTATION=+ /assembly_acc=CAM_ASM_000147
MASLKERMAMFTKASSKGDDDHKEFKKKSGNKEQPEKVGKLNHSYLAKDSNNSDAKPNRNFKIFSNKKKKEEEPKKEEAEAKPTTAGEEPKATEKTAAPPPRPLRKGGRGSVSERFKNTFMKNDMSGKLKKEQDEAAKKEKEAEEELEKQEADDEFVIPEGDEEAEEEEEKKAEKPKRGALRSFVQQSQRLSLGIFAKKKSAPTERSKSELNKGRNFGTADVNVNESKARDRAGIKLNQGNAAPPPRKRLSLLGRMGSSRRNANNNKMNAYNLVLDKGRADEVEEYLNKINTFSQSFTLVKRLSIRDNDIVQAVRRVIDNDPKQTAIKIDGDVRFGHLRSSMVQDFGDSIRKNLYLKSLTIRGVELGNTFLEALTSAIRDNVTLQEIDLSRNSFTHDALVEFCQALELNHTITTVRLQTQLSPVYEKGVETALAAIDKNRSIKSMTIDFQGDMDGKYDKRLKEVTQRNYWNKDNYPMPNPDDLLVNFLKDEVVRTEELHQQKMLEKDLEEVREGDWDYLYELAVLFDRFKISNEDEESKRSSAVQGFASPMHAAQSRNSDGFGTQGRNPLTGAQGFPSDGSFLTEEFIDAYLQEDPERGGLVFNFCNQARLFKQFPSTSPDRETIVNIFVYELLNHPRQQEFTGINMTNTMCGNDFWQKIAEGVLGDPDLFPNINMISAETNFLTEGGFVAIANMVKSEKSMRYLQVIKLDNQKALLSSKAERALARAMCVNLSIVRFSLRVRNLLERDQCNKYVVRNIDFLRQARRHHKINTGTLEERKRNAMEQLFDSVAANDESITEVNISADIKFTGLSDVEKVKSAKAFATNSHVKKVTMNQLQLGDKFAVALGEALEQNNTIERLVVEGNAFTGVGFKGIFAGLGKNSSVKELLGKHQTKSMSSPDEQALPGLLQDNATITKISLDLRNSAVTMQLDKICNQNRHKRISAQKPTERKRNAMEKYFDSIAANDESITEVNLSADVKFTGLSGAEKVKSAKAFATNSHVTKVTMNQLQLGDDFLIALGEALETNTTIERLVIEGNSFTGPGFKGLFTGLGKNSSVKELLGKHQTKSMSSSDEQVLPAFIEENTTISKISLDLRNSAVTMALDKICNRNHQNRRKKKNSSAVSERAADNAAAAVAATPAGSLRDSASVVPVPTNLPKSEEATEEEPEEKPEEKPFDEDKPPSEESPADEAPVDKVPEQKAASEETPFDERSEDQPFDEDSPKDEVSPTEDTPVDESPADEAAEAQAEEDAPADEAPETAQKEDNEAEEDSPAEEEKVVESDEAIEVVAAEETPIAEDAPAAEEQEVETEPEAVEEAPVQEEEPEPKPDDEENTPAVEEKEVETEPEAAEEAPVQEEESEPQADEEEDAPAAEEAETEPAAAAEEAPVQEEESEPQPVDEEDAPAAEEAETEPAAAEEAPVQEEESKPQADDEEDAPAAEETEPEAAEEAPVQEEESKPQADDEEDSPAAEETEPEAAEEAPVQVEESEPQPEPQPDTTEKGPAEEEPESQSDTAKEASAQEDAAEPTPEPEPEPVTSAQEAEAEPEPEPEKEPGAASAQEDAAEPTPEPEPVTSAQEAEPEPEPEEEPEAVEEPPAVPEAEPEGTTEEPAVPEAEPAPEPETAEDPSAEPETSADSPEEAPSQEKEAEAEPDTIIQAGDGEEIEVSASGEVAEEEEAAAETPVEEIDGKSAESWDVDANLDQ